MKLGTFCSCSSTITVSIASWSSQHYVIRNRKYALKWLNALFGFVHEAISLLQAEAEPAFLMQNLQDHSSYHTSACVMLFAFWRDICPTKVSGLQEASLGKYLTNGCQVIYHVCNRKRSDRCIPRSTQPHYRVANYFFMYSYRCVAVAYLQYSVVYVRDLNPREQVAHNSMEQGQVMLQKLFAGDRQGGRGSVGNQHTERVMHLTTVRPPTYISLSILCVSDRDKVVSNVFEIYPASLYLVLNRCRCNVVTFARKSAAL